ncbi:MAG: hypothetical protein AABY15_01435, partial [Nanoarchaeota archaeon]
GVQEDAHTLDIGPNFDFNSLMSDSYIRYVPHNIDNWTQASTSLILWLNWLNVIGKRLKES